MSMKEILNVLKENSDNKGLITISKKEIVEKCNISKASTSNISTYLRKLEGKNLIKIIEKPKNLGRGKWGSYKIKLLENKMSNINKQSNTANEISDYAEENFNGIKMRIYDTNKGKVVPISDIAKGLKVSRQTIHGILERNIELFNSYIVNVTLTAKENKCLTKEGIIGLLMKISYQRLSKDKQKLIIEFQKWATTMLSELISNGKVELSEQEHAKIQDNVEKVTSMSEKNIDILFNDIENLLTDKLHNLYEDVRTYKNQAEYSKKENNRLIARTVALREKIYSVR